MSLLTKYPRLKGCIFVVTYGRSGSTLLQKMLQTLQNSCIRGENYAALEPLFRAHKRATAARNQFGKLAVQSDDPWYGAHRIDPDSFGEKLAEIFVEEIIKPKVDVKWVGFKEIRYIENRDDLGSFINFITSYFPNPYIVFNSRNTDDVLSSGWWKGGDELKSRDAIKNLDEFFKQYSQEHPRNSFHAQHEETAKDPSSLAPLFQMLGEPMDIDTLRAYAATRLTH